MRRAIPLILVAFASLVHADGPATQPDVVAAWAGDWVIESSTGTESGQVFARMIGTVVTVSDGRMSWVEQHGVDQRGKPNWSWVDRKLVPRLDVSPVAVDIVADDGRYKAWSRKAILRIVDDEMHLCVNGRGGVRPTKF